MYRLRFLASMLVLALFSGGILLGEDKKDEKEPIIVKAQLPRYYKQLSLNDTQKKQVYKIRAKYASEVEKLKQQIAALQDREKEDLEGILTEAQRARLKELRGGGTTREKEPKAKPAGAVEKPAAKPEETKKK